MRQSSEVVSMQEARVLQLWYGIWVLYMSLIVVPLCQVLIPPGIVYIELVTICLTESGTSDGVCPVNSADQGIAHYLSDRKWDKWWRLSCEQCRPGNCTLFVWQKVGQVMASVLWTVQTRELHTICLTESGTSDGVCPVNSADQEIAHYLSDRKWNKWWPLSCEQCRPVLCIVWIQCDVIWRPWFK